MAEHARSDGREELQLTDTIYALSSGAPPAAVAVVRISGPDAHAALERLAGKLPPPRVAKLARLREGDDLLDSALVLRFDGPASETGEDVVELQLHGGRSVVAGVLGALGRIDGLRPAEAGEFTRRAFENGRIDLAEAEGLADLVESETQSQRRAALALAGGALSRRICGWQDQLLALSAGLEAALDFSDEEDVGAPEISATAAALAAEIDAALARPPAERLRDGIRVVIAGPPNAGKSTLFNALVGREAAITSPTAGTTRDVIETGVAIGGTPFILADTAGLRESGEEIEAIGIARARAQLAQADILLWLGAPGDCPHRQRAILVQSKTDLGSAPTPGGIPISATTGQGLEMLEAALLERSRSLLPLEGEVALNQRHREILSQVSTLVHDVALANDAIIAAEALRQARAALDRVTGRGGVEEMLDALFGRFCIGK